jgi:uroporphyrinogen decarboxylase
MANKTISHRERLETCLAGEKPDRVPVALWRHFPVDDQTPEGLAAATSAFQRLYDFDFIKVTPPSSYCLKDWGAEDRWSGNSEGTREYTNFVIQNPEDWEHLPILNPKHGNLGNQTICLRILTSEFSSHLPIIQTVYSPLAQAKNLVGADRLSVHIRKYPQQLKAGLERIMQSTILWVEELIKVGIDGIFFAVQHAQYGLLNDAEFEAFGASYDIPILKIAKPLWLNMVHLHGENVMFDSITRYETPAINWHDRHTPPSLQKAQELYTGVVCGGLRRWESMVLGTPQQIHSEALDAIQTSGGKRFILGTGCVLPITAPYGNILAARQSVDDIDSL